jgi:hypothetical protein
MQTDLFEQLGHDPLFDENAPAIGHIEGLLNAMVSQSIGNSGFTRSQIIDRINLCLRDDPERKKVTNAQLNKWLAPSQTNNHMPAWVIPGICWATRSIHPLSTLSKPNHFDLVDNRVEMALSYGKNIIDQKRLKKEERQLTQEILRGKF